MTHHRKKHRVRRKRRLGEARNWEVVVVFRSGLVKTYKVVAVNVEGGLVEMLHGKGWAGGVYQVNGWVERIRLVNVVSLTVDFNLPSGKRVSQTDLESYEAG